MAVFKKAASTKPAITAGTGGKKEGFIAKWLKRRAARRQAKEAARIQKIKDAALAKTEKTKVMPPVHVAEKGKVETRKPVGAIEREIPIEETEKLNKMAKKAASIMSTK